jgi:uncharacterized protein (DUF608 family)
MSSLRRFNRRKFLGVTAAAAGAGAGGLVQISGAQQKAAAKARYTSPAGGVIPFSKSDLYAPGSVRVFEGPHLNEIAFPLGGIGTGTVSLGGRGNLRDWEIFNRPNKGGTLPFSFIALWVKEGEGKPATKVVEAPVPPPYRGAQGIPRESGEGLPRFRGARFIGSYPVARIEFADPTLPLDVSLEAFTPFIPLEADDSGLPVAVLRYTLKSRSKMPIRASLAFSLENPVGYDGVSGIATKSAPAFGKNLNEFAQGSGFRGLRLTSSKYPGDDPRFGSMALVTSAELTSHLLRWSGGEWWDDFHEWWNEFSESGRFAKPGTPTPSADGATDIATLVAEAELKPGGRQDVTFLLAWHFPVRENYWNSEPAYKGKRFRNQYAERFPDAWGVAEYTVANLSRLERDTRTFRECFFQSSLPAAVLDAASSQMSIIRTNTCMFIEGRQFFAFEGCNDNSGCCPMNCTHVWNYEQALAHLFPELERSMRNTDFKHNLRPDGAMVFRTGVPLGTELWNHAPAADGQMGCVMKMYREWQLSGDDAWLRDLWPQVKKALDYAWVQWDANRDGVMEGEQHNTYDIEFYGPNSMMGTLYLGALRAGEIMARAVGDQAAADQYRAVRESGTKKLDSELWNGDYFIQRYNESEHAKYQFGEGCLSDQLLGEWFAAVVGLGPLLPQEHVRKTLQSIYRNNFRHDFTDFANPQRIYALNDEKGLLLCSWPKGNRPALPFVYSDEVWTGIEYQVAAHLIYEGMVDEGLAIVRACRDRYDGLRRNPWNEVECGSHYARAMSSWSLLLALSGYHYSATEKWISFAPLVNAQDFRCFFSTGNAWGIFSQKAGEKSHTATLEVKKGTLELSELRLKSAFEAKSVTATLAGQPVDAALSLKGYQARIVLSEAASVGAGQSFEVVLSSSLS